MFKDSLSRLTGWIFFVILFYNVLTNIIMFLGIDEYVSKMYIFWFSVLLLLISIAPTKIDLNI
jgi:hypothetical protein